MVHTSLKAQLITGLPTIAVIADMQLDNGGLREMARWVKHHRPACLPEGYDPEDDDLPTEVASFTHSPERALVPHAGWRAAEGQDDEINDYAKLTGNELLVELAGRKCYDSFGERAGRKTNERYIRDTQQGAVPHRSILYHAKMSFFFGDLSRRVSHELIRNYVGADRDEEGAPSQESTRYTEHYGYFVLPPRVAAIVDASTRSAEVLAFHTSVSRAYDDYLAYVARETDRAVAATGSPPSGMDRKRVYEAASHYLPHSAATSFVWTTNPAALTKLLVERDNPAADAEFQRFARYLKVVCVRRWPNLFQPFADEFKRAGFLVHDDEAGEREVAEAALGVDFWGAT